MKDFPQSNLAEHFLKMRVLSKWDPSGRGGNGNSPFQSF